MSKKRFAIFLMMALSLLLLGTVPAQDAGQYLILSAQYGSEQRHVDVTNRLKDLARRDQQFRLDFRTFNVDPDEGHAKSLRIFARGPNGRERMFEYRDGSIIDGAQFRGWGSGQWGGDNDRWSGNWNGGDNDRDRDRDSGQFLILSAQYGSERRHVDVTNRLKEMARGDRQFRLDFRTFGVDPDEGHAKSLRIFARDPNGRERMFEYRDGSIIDGAQFRGWGSGQWGGDNDRWSGNWNGGYGGGREPQPEMTAALQNLREAKRDLESASHDKGGHRVNALQHVQQAIAEVEAGIQYDNTH
jgi:hypothetical protein